MKGRKRGVITVFVSLLLVAVLSFVGTVTEAVRIFGARMQAQIIADCGIDSLLSQYDALLMENYHLFFMNGMEGEDVFLQENFAAGMKEYMSYNLSPQSAHSLLTHSDFWQLSIEDCLVKEYALATDNGCAAYRKQAADSVKGVIGAELLGQLKDWEGDPVDVSQLEASLEEREKENEEQLQQVKEDAIASKNVAKTGEEASETAGEETSNEENTTADEGNVTADEENVTADEESVKAKQVQQAVDSVENDTKVNDEDNPIAIIKEIKEKGILQLVMPKDMEISEKEISTDNLVSKRSLNVGNMMASSNSTLENIEEKLLFHEYLMHTFSNALEEKESTLPKGRALSYELEYLIAGKDSDIENLKSVVHSLLLIREAVNYGYLLTDTVKQLQAETLAVAITSAVGMVALTTVVKHGILLAWAYGESIMDVRQLMAGGSISFVKTAENWQLALENFGSFVEESDNQGEKQAGELSYVDYLRILLFAENEQKLTLRSLDLIEQSMRKQPGRSDYMADALVAGLVMETTFQTNPVFYSLWPMHLRKEIGSYAAVSKGQYMMEKEQS